MKTRLLIFTSFISVLFTMSSCIGEPKEAPLKAEDVLPGYWELINATRNGTDVTSLQGAYFEFDTLGNISTNFSGEQVVSEYSIKENAILFKDAGKESKFDFLIKSPDTLQFNTEMRKIFKFELLLLRSDKDQ